MPNFDQLAKNANFTKDLLSTDASLRKQANADLNKWLVTYQRQDGVFRQFVPPTPVENSDFAESLTTRDPHVIRTIKPRSAGAVVTNFDTGTMSTGMYADKYPVFLHRVWTPKYRIDKAYLAAYKGDLLGVMKDLSLQDLLGAEDIEGMSLLHALVGEKNGALNEDIGIRQYVDCGEVVDQASITHLVEGLTYSLDNLSPAKGMVHRSFWYKLSTVLKADHVGQRIAENAFLGNVTALEESLIGIKWLTVLDRKLIDQNTAYVAADAEFCGDFLTWGDATLFTEVKDGIWVEMFAHEMIGIAFPNRGCVVRGDFGAPAVSWTDAEISSSSSN